MDGNDHSASRRADVLAADAPALVAPTTTRQRALLEIVDVSYQLGLDDEGGVARIRQLARHLLDLEPPEQGFWVDPDSREPAEAKLIRRRAALLALAAYPYAPCDLTDPDDFATAAGDLMADLLHAVDVHAGEEYVGLVLDRAQRHHRDETSRRARRDG